MKIRCLLLSTVIGLCILLGGCTYKGAKIVEGTDFVIGLDVPSTDGALQITLVNYLSGFRVGIIDNARLQMSYTVSETNSFLGISSSKVHKTIDIVLEPCEDDTSSKAKDKQDQ